MARATHWPRRAGHRPFVVGEVRHHELLDAYARGLTVYDAGHFPTELPGVMSLYERFLADATRAGWAGQGAPAFSAPLRGRASCPLEGIPYEPQGGTHGTD